MAGRGRGRGRGKGLSFNVESLGFGRGETLPGTIVEPPPAYPQVGVRAVPLAKGSNYDFLLSLKQEYRANMKESLYYIKPNEKRRDIDRYSDKFQFSQQNTKQGRFIWSSLPKELEPRKAVKRKAGAAFKPNTKSKSKLAKDAEEIVKTLEELEKKEGKEAEGEEEEEQEQEKEETEETKKKAAANEEDAEIEEEVDEEELEDDTDYALNYFDNGETFGADEDDNLEDDEAIYY